MLECPSCGSQRIWKDGLRYYKGRPIQRHICRSCGYRFSQSSVEVNIPGQCPKSLDSRSNLPDVDITGGEFPVEKRVDSFPFQRGEDVASHNVTIVAKPINTFRDCNRDCQVCVNEKKMKNLVKVETRIENRAPGATTLTPEIKGKILEFAWWLKKNGFANSTITRYVQACRTLTSLGANLLDPETVKGVIAKQKWREGTKLNYANFYDTFTKFHGLKWQKPKYRNTQKLPFIPLESEIDLLIHGTGKKISTTLQIIKETGMRIGEALRLKWTDIDPERNIITLNYAEKHGRNRMFKVSTQLIQRLLALPRKKERIFSSRASVTSNFFQARKRLAREYNNPRLMRISFHTIRHWKATTVYHKTKDILYVKNMLGHVSLNNTLIYITLEQTLFGESDNQEFHVRVAKNIDEACELIEQGFNYVCDMDNTKIFRQRK